MKNSSEFDLIYYFISLSPSRMEEEQEDNSRHGMEGASYYNAWCRRKKIMGELSRVVHW